MTWDTRYLPPTGSLWQGRTDSPAGSAFFQVIKLLDLREPIKSDQKIIRFALLGFACDEGIRRNQGRVGAAEGPDAIKSTLAKLPIQRQDVICYDAGNIICTDGNLEEAQSALGQVVQLLMQHHIVPIVLGGGHEMAWGHFLGIQPCLQQKKLGLVNFDAHLDMRPLLPQQLGSSGTPFLQIATAMAEANLQFDYNCIGVQRAGNQSALLQTAEEKHAHLLWADDLHQHEIAKCMNFVERIIDQNEMIYVSICLDVFATPYAPGVSAPQTLGLTPWQIIPHLRQLATSGKVTNYDLAELSPPYDQDQRTAKLAAHLIFEIIHHHINDRN